MERKVCKKAIFIFLAMAVLLIAGCAKPSQPKENPQTPEGPDTTHLRGENNSLGVAVSREIKSLSGMNINGRDGYEVVSLQVSIDNNSKKSVIISPAYVSLQTLDGAIYKYSAQLTQSLTGKAAFKEAKVATECRGGGLLIFELKKGAIPESITYNDQAGHNIPIKFPQDNKPKTI
ncbi:MAG: hypothetical protein PHV60_07915 [bacterium]|nr:hypothetical protein [bacterium]